MCEYNELLEYFNFQNQYDDVMELKSYVSMDNLHDAIVKVGVDLMKPISHYIVTAKQNAIMEYREMNSHYRIIMANRDTLMNLIEFDNLYEYGFTDEELDLINERMRGIRKYKSAIPRRKYEKLLISIREKINT